MRVGDEVVWIGAPNQERSPSGAKKRGRTTYLVTRRHAVVITRRGRRTHTKAVRLDRVLPPGIDDHGTVWLPSAEPRPTLVAAFAPTSTMRQRRKAKQLRFTGLADAQRVHDVIIAAQSRRTAPCQ